ncbi:hypothetical protein [Desulfosediminicola sp.]|uniref:hypothetical protein n=1 Tax=Desulfosediminicola sp. TaxID=2886825 RepID=UPI003AF223EB
MTSYDFGFFAVTLLSYLVFNARAIAYEDYRSFLDMRFIATCLLFIVFTRHLMRNELAMRILAYAILAQGLVVTLVRIVNYYYFPYVMISYGGGSDNEAFINTEGSLTRDLLLGSSISANIILCGMFVNVILVKHLITKVNSFVFLSMQLLMLLSVFTTISRFPIVIAIIFFLFSFLQLRLIKLRTLFGIICVISVTIFTITSLEVDYLSFFDRFGETSGRYDKLKATFLLVSNSMTDFAIGSSSELVNSTMVNGLTISDNSYGLVATTFGIPFMIIFFAFLFRIFTKIKSDSYSILFLLYISLAFGITNSILWEPWVFTAFLTLGVSAFYGYEPSKVWRWGHRSMETKDISGIRS